MSKTILPGECIGILGGGQLGRMMAIAAKQMGFRTVVLDPTKDNPCAQVSDVAIFTNYDDRAGAKKLADCTDVITYEFENVDLGTVELLEKIAYLPQGRVVLETTKDRLNEKTAIHQLGIPVAPFYAVTTKDDLKKAIEELGTPSVLKTTQGGYDGKGQLVIKTDEDLKRANEWVDGSTPYILEQWVPFEKEISVIVTRSTTGETAVFPVAENIHENNILHYTVVPARITQSVSDKTMELATKIARELDIVGTLAIEMFLTKDHDIYVNELAPRPHNSGHFTINACETSQFEQHIRAICGWPLGKTTLLKPVIMVNILGQHMEAIKENIAKYSDAHLHLYGKEEAKTGRKMGHLTLLADSVEEAIEKAELLNIWQIEKERSISK
ncbi:5-(carboxyamino)imidazole ribonucleotide synthase [Terrilactibacillus laevilacticus]|uniref:N5-carboxyaminoimidazole ribonucleotide synthase n=1 Tax=Terrilactibacillus laevilacticus TaxID=1380157 RepID=A0ABW5PMZ4_9BACI|nr:5-(carboxyamino)imidazole ribonucleotide synthase [Terrilactibacillus laevilacticus]